MSGGVSGPIPSNPLNSQRYAVSEQQKRIDKTQPRLIKPEISEAEWQEVDTGKDGDR